MRALKRAHALRVAGAALALAAATATLWPVFALGSGPAPRPPWTTLLASTAALALSQLVAQAATYRVLCVRREVYSRAFAALRLWRPEAVVLVLVHVLSGVSGAAAFRYLHGGMTFESVVVVSGARRLLDAQTLAMGAGAAAAGAAHALLLLWREENVLSFAAFRASRALALRRRAPLLLWRALRRGLGVALGVALLGWLGAVQWTQAAAGAWYSTDVALLRRPGPQPSALCKTWLVAAMLSFFWALGHALLEVMLTAPLDFEAVAAHSHGAHWPLVRWALRHADKRSLEALLQAARKATAEQAAARRGLAAAGVTGAADAHVEVAWTRRLREQQWQFQEAMAVAADRRKADRTFRREPAALWVHCAHAQAFQHLADVGLFDEEARRELLVAAKEEAAPAQRDDAIARWADVCDACTTLLDSLTMRLQIAQAAAEVCMGSGGVGPERRKAAEAPEPSSRAVEWHAERAVRQQSAAAGPWYAILLQQGAPMHPSEGAEAAAALREDEEQLGRGPRRLRSLARAALARTPRQRTQALFDDAQTVVWAADAVSLLLHAAYAEDALGVAQQFVPTALNSLLSCLIAVEAYVRCPGFGSGGGTRGGHQLLRAQPFAVATALERAVYRLVTTYYEHLAAFSLPAQQAGKLQSFLDFSQ